MNRRTFLAGLGSALCLSARKRVWGQGLANPMTFPADLDADPCGGFTLQPPKQFLFTDLRHIEPADLGWRTADGQSLPLVNPPQPVVPAFADPDRMPRGIRLVAQKAAKEGPLKIPGNITYDNGVYRAWAPHAHYPPGSDFGSYSEAAVRSITIDYGESKNGYDWHWHKGTQEIKFPNITGVDGECFFIDPHAPESERFKCLFHAAVVEDKAALWKRYQKLHPRYRDDRLSEAHMSALFGMVSPDGREWTAIPEPLMIHKGDTDNCVYYDAWLGKYVLYTRLYLLRRRMIARAESDDFRHWTPVDPIIWPDLEPPYSHDIYTNARCSYPGLPEYHLMFPMHYLRYTQASEIHLYTSMEGIRWNRVPGGPIISTGDPGTWEGGFVYAIRSLVPLGKDRVGIVFSGNAYPHKYPRWPKLPPPTGGTGWATWTKGRLVGLVAEEEGEFRTFLMKVTGKQLRINAKIHRAGEIRVSLGSVPGRTMKETDPISGDGTDLQVTWKGNPDVGVKPSDSVALHVKMRAAELYGIEWV